MLPTSSGASGAGRHAGECDPDDHAERHLDGNPDRHVDQPRRRHDAAAPAAPTDRTSTGTRPPPPAPRPRPPRNRPPRRRPRQRRPRRRHRPRTRRARQRGAQSTPTPTDSQTPATGAAAIQPAATHPAELRGIAPSGSHRPPHRDPLHRLRRASRDRARPRDVPGLGPGRIARTGGGHAAGEQRGRAGSARRDHRPRRSRARDQRVRRRHRRRSIPDQERGLGIRAAVVAARDAAADGAEAADKAAHRVRVPRASASDGPGQRRLGPANPRHLTGSADPPRVSARGRGRAGGRHRPPRRRRRKRHRVPVRQRAGGHERAASDRQRRDRPADLDRRPAANRARQDGRADDRLGASAGGRAGSSRSRCRVFAEGRDRDRGQPEPRARSWRWRTGRASGSSTGSPGRGDRAELRARFDVQGDHGRRRAPERGRQSEHAVRHPARCSSSPTGRSTTPRITGTRR